MLSITIGVITGIAVLVFLRWSSDGFIIIDILLSILMGTLVMFLIVGIATSFVPDEVTLVCEAEIEDIVYDEHGPLTVSFKMDDDEMVTVALKQYTAVNIKKDQKPYVRISKVGTKKNLFVSQGFVEEYYRYEIFIQKDGKEFLFE